jgi:hypothetical protein
MTNGVCQNKLTLSCHSERSEESRCVSTACWAKLDVVNSDKVTLVSLARPFDRLRVTTWVVNPTTGVQGTPLQKGLTPT